MPLLPPPLQNADHGPKKTLLPSITKKNKKMAQSPLQPPNAVTNCAKHKVNWTSAAETSNDRRLAKIACAAAVARLVMAVHVSALVSGSESVWTCIRKAKSVVVVGWDGVPLIKGGWMYVC